MQVINKTAGRWLVAPIAGLAMSGMVGAACAASTSADNSAAQSAPTWQYRAQLVGPESVDRGLVGAFQKLDLNAQQRVRLQHILAGARRQFAQEREVARSNFPTLMNPGSPNFDQAVRVAKDNALARINLATRTEREIYALLTPAQRSQLPSVLSTLRAQWMSSASERGH